MKTTDLISEKKSIFHWLLKSKQDSTVKIVDKIVKTLEKHSKEFFDQFKNPQDIFFDRNPVLINAKAYLFQIDLFLQEYSQGKYHTLQHLVCLAARPFQDTLSCLLKNDKDFGNRYDGGTHCIYTIPMRYIYEKYLGLGINETLPAIYNMERHLLRHLNNYTDDITENVKQDIDSLLKP